MRSSAFAESAGTIDGVSRVAAFSLKETVRSYVQLTKPRIVLLFALTGFAPMVMAGTLDLARTLAVLAGMVLTAGAANALNQYLDRDIDAVMGRTKEKRPLPSGRLSPQNALWFGLITGTIATLILYVAGNALAAAFGVATIVYYVGIYTMWLKRRTPYNIVIGGAAGATAPLIGWAAATGHVSMGAFLMFLIIFMWTPPHFWALALCIKDEYKQVAVPMLPVVKGDEATREQIVAYTAVLLPLTLTLVLTKDCGWGYLAAAVVLGAIFLKLVLDLKKRKDKKTSWKVFGYSIFYLLALFVAMIGDAVAAEKRPMELENVGITERLGANVDLNLRFRNEKGEVVALRSVVDGRKPVLLFLAYYGCPNLCNLFLNGATEALKQLEWTAGGEFQVLTVSIDPTEESGLATAKKASHIEALGRPAAAEGWHFWVNDVKGAAPKNEVIDEETSVRKLANQVGFGYKYDKAQGQYAHSAAMVVLTPDGRVARYLYGIDFKPRDLRLALVEASDRKIGGVMDRILLFCYNYDPRTQKYALYATNLMRAGGGLTVLILSGILVNGWRRRRRVA